MLTDMTITWITDPTDSKLHNIVDAVGDVSGNRNEDFY